jgi:S1-C subfamily serine protease
MRAPARFPLANVDAFAKVHRSKLLPELFQMRLYVPLAAALFVGTLRLLPGAISSAPPQDASHSCLLVQSFSRLRNGGTASGNGTGFLVDRDLVMTCNHLMRIPTPIGVVSAQQVKVQVGENEHVAARIVARDETHDLALLQLERPVTTCEALRVAPFSVQRESPVRIIGNFPDQVRTTRGKLLSPNAMEGFALSSAKVYSGFSGGPILNQQDEVQGILSQRDDNNNSIFVRSEVIADLLTRYANKNSRTIASLEPAGSTANYAGTAEPAAPEMDSASSASAASAAPRKTSLTAELLVKTTSSAAKPATARTAAPQTRRHEEEEVVVAIPVRKAATHYTSQTNR